MARRRGMFERPFVKCKDSRMGSFVGLMIILAIVECRGDYMMGGHLDNKEDQGMMEHRTGEDELRTSGSGSRTPSLEDVDHEFDLELDLFGEQSGADPTRISVVNGSSGSLSSGDETTTMNEDSSTAPRYRVLPYAFNGGHPFSLEKDPITGQIDFEKAPPLKALEYHVKTPPQTEEPKTGSELENSSIDSSKEQDEESGALGPNEINPYSPSFHDFLNLPVRYTYDKYKNSEKYPLISNSYANTKVQSGSNSYNTYNHKKYHEAVKAGVDVQTLYVQPLRKTYSQSITKTSTTRTSSTKPTTSTTTTTTTRPSTTKKTTTTTTITTTTTPAPSSSTTTKRSRYPAVTTWKPQQKPSGPSVYGTYEDYEGTLPIERLQSNNPEKQETTTTTTTEKSRYQTPPPRAKPEQKKPEPQEDKNEEYEEGYDEDYDRILQITDQPNQDNQNDHSNDSQDDYSYGIMDFVGGLRPSTKAPPSTSSAPTSTTTLENFGYSSEATTSTTSAPITTSNVPTTVNTRDDENRTTTAKPSEEKRITSMPIDTIGYNDNYRVPNYGNSGGIVGTIDNSIPNNNLLYQHTRPSSNENYYARPPIGMPSGGIVVKSTSNVVVPPGQDTVSFVLGNRQSVGSVSDAGSDFYGIHSSDMNERPSVSFGKISGSRPVDNFGGSMIVSAGIGVGSNPIGPYHQRPPTSGNNFDHAVVTVGMPTVDVVNPGESGSNKKPDSTSNTLDTLAQKWWASTSSSANNQPSISEGSQDSSNQQFGYRVVFPNEKGQSSSLIGSENSPETQRPVEEHVIVVHESEIGNGNTLHLDLSSHSTSSPTTNYHHESTTHRLPVNPDEKLLPELSESLTPPAERPNILPSGIQRPPSYNYYHHSSHPPGNSRPNDYRGPGRLPTPSSNNFKRRPTTTIESNLPNILPQFRPNAKTSHGHNRGETIGTIPAGSVPPYVNTRIRRPPSHVHHHQSHRPATSRRPSGPPHLQRLNPPPLPPTPPPISSLRLPTPASLVASPNLGLGSQHDSGIQNNENSVRLGGPNRLHKVSLGAPPSLSIDQRHHQPNGFVNKQPIKSRLEDDTLERFSAEPPVRLPYFTKRTTNGEPDGIPRIATLQMIQQHSGPRDDDNVRPNLPPPYRFNEKPSAGQHDSEKDEENEENSSGVKNDQRENENEEKLEVSQQGNEATRADYVDTVDSPVYVVYPVKGALDIRPTSNDDGDQDDASVVLGTYGFQRPLPPDTLLKDSEDNESGESPFRAPTIVNVSPSFTESSGPQLASDFPYPLEKSDPSMFSSQLREKPLLVPSEQQKNGERLEIDVSEEKRTEETISEANGVRDIERDASVNVIPYLQDHVPFTLKENAGVISATLHRFSSSPSIVAASSTPIAYVYTPTTRAPVRRHEDPYVQGSFERGPVLLPSQQPSSSSSSAPSPQSFMAPFVASASAEAPSKNGWSVVMPGQSSGEDSSIDRRRHDPPSQENDKSTKNEGENSTQRDKNFEDKDEDKKRVKDDSKTVETPQTEETDSQTEKSEFDVENFTPQLFGGFRPIFEFPSDSDTEPNLGDKVTDDSGSMIERPRSETG